MAQTTWRGERDARFVAGNTVIILSYYKNTHTQAWSRAGRILTGNICPTRPAVRFGSGSGSGRESNQDGGDAGLRSSTPWSVYIYYVYAPHYRLAPESIGINSEQATMTNYDTPSSVEINAGGSHWRPIQDGSRADTSAPIGSVSLWGIYVYYVYGINHRHKEQMLHGLLGHKKCGRHLGPVILLIVEQQKQQDTRALCSIFLI